MMVRIATWNINSIRVRLELLKSVISSNNIDVILLQETKCQNCDFPISEVQSMGMNCLYNGQKSYNGVAILSKYPLELEFNSLPLYDLQDNDDEARYIEAITTIDGKIIRIASIYVPMGGGVLRLNEKLEDSVRFKYKLNFYKRLKKRIEELKHDTSNFQDEYLIFAGDMNVAQEEIDLSHPKANDGNVGFHPYERRAFRDIRAVGLEDAFRVIHPFDRQYSWWDYRTRAFERDVGWRLDYLLASQNVITNAKKCFVDMKTRAQQRTSDHAPNIIEFEI